MRWITIILLFISSFTCWAQLDSIKHIELISEVEDSMALISHTDINKINKTFHDKVILDSLNRINLQIIETLELKNSNLEKILSEQKAIIQNEVSIRSQLEYETKVEINYYKKTLLKERRKRIGWQSATGVSVVAILLLILI